jgi:hypothetical protein
MLVLLFFCSYLKGDTLIKGTNYELYKVVM